jgi:hypothetical protein
MDYEYDYEYKATVSVCVGLLLGCGLSICGGFILGIRKLKLENPSYREVENRILDIQSHQSYQMSSSNARVSSASSSSSSSSSSNPFVRLIQGFTGSGNSAGYEQLRDVEGEEFGRQSREARPRTKPTTVDVGNQVCQEIIGKRERRSRCDECLRECEGTPREGFIQDIFDTSNRNTSGKGTRESASAPDPKLSALYTCAVCLEDLCLGNTNMTTTGCGHTFHLSCLLKSLSTKNRCPMCRWELEDSRPSTQTPNVLTPVSAEQIISEEISYFPNAAHAHSIALARHPKRRLKDLLRVFGFTLLRSVAEYVHDDNMPAGWYDDGESDESDESDDSEESNESNENGENGGETDEEHDPVGSFIIDTHGQRQTSPIVGDLRQHIGT